MAETFRIGTWNIHHAAPEGKYFVRPWKLSRALRELDELDIDILALQEVGGRNLFSGFADLGTKVLERAGMQSVFAPTMRHYQGGSYGNALLVRGNIIKSQVAELAGDYRYRWGHGDRVRHLMPEPRNTILASVEVRGHVFNVTTGHLSTESNTSWHQLHTVLGKLVRHSRPQVGEDLPLVLLGDFNMSPTGLREQLAARRLSGLKVVKSEATCPATNPAIRPDHIAVQGLHFCSKARTLQLPVSDHRALMVDVALSATPS